MNPHLLVISSFRPVARGLIWFLLTAVLVPAAPLRADSSFEVVVEGIEGDLLDNVKAALEPPAGFERNGGLDSRLLAQFQRRAPQKASEALKPFGYYHPDIKSELQKLEDKDYRLVVTIAKGPPVRVTKVAVRLTGEGSSDKVLRSYVRDFPLKEGDILDQTRYSRGKNDFSSRARDLGYLNAEFTEHVIRLNPEQNRAEIQLTFDTGPRFYFGPTTIHGAEGYPEPFLRRYLSYREGDPFSYSVLGETQLNFLDSDRFREADVIPHQEEALNQQVPIEIVLEPSLPKRLRPGIGYATDIGPRATLRYQDVNFWHLGHQLESEFALAQKKQTLGAAYIIPSKKNLYSQTAVRTGLDREELDAFDKRSFFVEVERARAFRKGRQGSVYLRYLEESFEIGTTDAVSRMVIPGVRFSQQRFSRSRSRIRKGYLFNLETRGGSRTLGSDSTFGQILVSGFSIVRLPWRFKLINRLQGGFTAQVNAFDNLPPSLRFFAGGDRSVRGYAYQSLGPTDESGEVIGGKNMVAGTFEIEKELGDSWGVAAFYDAGDAYNSLFNIRIYQGAGLGVRYYTPVGPISIDLARQIGIVNAAYRFHITMGFGW